MKSSKEYWVLNILESASEKTEEGGVKGRLKMQKLSVLVQEDLDDRDNMEWNTISDFRGPRQKGLSRLLMSLDELDMAELEQMRDETTLRRITKKGRDYFQSLDKFLNKMDPEFEEKRNSIEDDTISENIDKSGNELVEKEEIQDLKDNPLEEDL